MAEQEMGEGVRQGSVVWNAWREQQSEQVFDLSGADLGGADLSFAKLRHADLNRTNLRSTTLSAADLRDTDLRYADLSDADLRAANLRSANLIHTNLGYTNLTDTHLRHADLSDANLSAADLRGANLQGAIVWETVFAHVDLREVKGLTELRYKGPSRVELYTILLPQDGSTLHFLRSVGVPDEWIGDYRARMMHPIQYHSCFISYSNKDDSLAHRLHADLQAKGVRCWCAPEDMKIGDEIRTRIDEAIHLQDKLLLLLSEHSLASTWVKNDVEAALEKEEQQHRLVLFPVRLDDCVENATQAWATTLRRSRHIGNFTSWTNPQAYQQAFERLLRDLKAE